jgi:superfamily I DNA/RNA helicase
MENFGLLVRGPWYDCIAKISDEDRQYMKQIEDSGRQLTDPALIRVSTISTIKGAEADHVILFSDIAYPEVLQMRRGGGEVHRKQYVAVTRTKETLHIILAKNFENSYPLLSLWQDLEKEQIRMEEVMYEKTRSSEFSLPL